MIDESQIESKTATGIIVKHDGYSHFFFYSDLKGSKWDYSIPKGYKDTLRQETSSAATSKASTTGHHGNAHASDGYVFNPNDIVSEDANGSSWKSLSLYLEKRFGWRLFVQQSSKGLNKPPQQIVLLLIIRITSNQMVLRMVTIIIILVLSITMWIN
ncbi:pneumococcal-type histidine triad protein [Streptococcus dysgalactiae]|nr:pneumococcal-type histidine triad protein [Streptococcus dysgalactiae]